MLRPMTDVLVVGAGIAGLTAAALLARKGRAVVLLEAHHQSGGCAGTFRRGPYVFDVGATQVAGLEPGGIHARLFADLGVEPPAATPLDPGCVVDLADGSPPVAQPEVSARGRQPPLQGCAQGLHRPMQMPEPPRLLHHREHGGAIEGRRAIGGFLGVEAQLQIQEAAQALIASAAAEAQQIRHRGGGEQATAEHGGIEGRQQLAEIPGGAGWQHRIAAGEAPGALMQPGAQLPEGLAAGELALPFLPPVRGIAPVADRLARPLQQHAAAGIQRPGGRQRQAEVLDQARMAAARFRARHLGGAHIPGVRTATEG
ncbi:MAG: FAD-dependent oxidoreductase, partial [Cyanobium sp.]